MDNYETKYLKNDQRKYIFCFDNIKLKEKINNFKKSTIYDIAELMKFVENNQKK